MRFDHAARLERLLDRHQHEIQLVGGASGNGALIRKDQILAVGRDADQVHDKAARWVVDRHDDDSGVSVLHLRKSAQVDVCELAESLSAGTRHRTLAVGPNHVLTASPHWGAGPFDDPTPTTVAMPAPSTSMSGRDVTVAILDTGIADHPWFDGRPWFAACGSDVRETPDSIADDRLDSVAGHGTFIAGVVLQHAPGAHLLVDRVISGDGVTDELRLLQGLLRLRSSAHAASTPIDIVSLSLGCYTHDDRPSPALRHGIDSFGQNTVFVACAGNAASERPYWPAAMKKVTAVGSLDATGLDRAPFSNYGWWVDACAIGDQVESSFFTYDGLGPEGNESFNGYAVWSGTSFAAPRVAGVIAARAAARDIPVTQAAAELLDPSRHHSMPDLGVYVDAPTGGASL